MYLLSQKSITLQLVLSTCTLKLYTASFLSVYTGLLNSEHYARETNGTIFRLGAPQFVKAELVVLLLRGRVSSPTFKGLS